MSRGVGSYFTCAELMLMTAVLYLIMSYPLSLLTRRLEKRYGNAPVGT